MANYVYGENVSGAFPNVSMSIEQITPDTAAKMLEHNEGNRKLQVRKADSTRAIENNEFVLNGETIKQLKYSPGGAHPEQFPEIYGGWN